MLTGPCSLQSKQYHFRIPYHSVLVRVLESGQPKDYAFGVCCFSAKHAALRDKNKDRLAGNHDNVSRWSDMSTRGMFQHCQDPTQRVGLVQRGHRLHLVECYLFSP